MFESDKIAKIANGMAHVFAENEWRWANERGGAYIPDKTKIYSRLEYLLDKFQDDIAYENIDSFYSVETGRIMLLWDKEFDTIEFYLNYGKI